MLEYLHLKNVGPAPEMEMALAPRLNLITGDNGPGKSFLLDVAWWALTRTWAGYAVRPSQNIVSSRREASISFRYEAERSRRTLKSRFVPADQAWTGGPGRPANPGLVLYARVDGGFALWDPLRNRKAREIAAAQELPNGNLPRMFRFEAHHVWEGLPGGGGQMTCNGLVRDWVIWQLENGLPFQRLSTALETLSEGGDLLRPARPRRVSIDDARDFPTIRTSYGEDVAVVLASAATRRIAALAYLLVWSWTEHERVAAQLGVQPTRRLIFLVDEVECHLHPRWQRTIIPSLLRLVRALAADAKVQLVVATLAAHPRIGGAGVRHGAGCLVRPRPQQRNLARRAETARICTARRRVSLADERRLRPEERSLAGGGERHREGAGVAP